jgi:uncharacterized caspase-like protein
MSIIRVEKLKQKYRQDVKFLTNNLNQNIKKISSQRNINNFLKNNLIKKLTNDYKNAVANLYKKLLDDIKAINIQTQNQTQILSVKNKYALLIGINYNGTDNQLYGCINDINNIKQILINQYGYLEQNIVALTDDLSNNIINSNLFPTNNNIINQFTNLLKKAQPGDQLVFAYSGHGSYIFDKNNDELTKRNNDSVLVPLDSLTNYNKLIVDDQIKQIINTNLKSGVELFAIIDSCNSGTVFDLRFNYLDSDNGNKTTINNKEIITPSKVVMISGCTDKQTSADDEFIDNSGNIIYAGALTYTFLNILKKSNYQISYLNLLKEIRTNLKQNRYSQIPQLSSGQQLDLTTNFIM